MGSGVVVVQYGAINRFMRILNEGPILGAIQGLLWNGFMRATMNMAYQEPIGCLLGIIEPH